MRLHVMLGRVFGRTKRLMKLIDSESGGGRGLLQVSSSVAVLTAVGELIRTVHAVPADETFIFHQSTPAQAALVRERCTQLCVHTQLAVGL